VSLDFGRVWGEKEKLPSARDFVSAITFVPDFRKSETLLLGEISDKTPVTLNSVPASESGISASLSEIESESPVISASQRISVSTSTFFRDFLFSPQEIKKREKERMTTMIKRSFFITFPQKIFCNGLYYNRGFIEGQFLKLET